MTDIVIFMLIYTGLSHLCTSHAWNHRDFGQSKGGNIGNWAWPGAFLTCLVWLYRYMAISLRKRDKIDVVISRFCCIRFPPNRVVERQIETRSKPSEGVYLYTRVIYSYWEKAWGSLEFGVYRKNLDILYMPYYSLALQNAAVSWLKRPTLKSTSDEIR